MAVLVARYDPQLVSDPKAIEAWQDRCGVKAPVFAPGVFVLRTNDPPPQVFDALQACLKPQANLLVGILGATTLYQARALRVELLGPCHTPQSLIRTAPGLGCEIDQGLRRQVLRESTAALVG